MNNRAHSSQQNSREALFDGLERTSSVVRRYSAIETVYVRNTPSQTQGALQNAILKVYERILGFKAGALCQRLAEFCANNKTDVNFRILITSRPDSGLRDAFAEGSKSEANMIQLNGESEQDLSAITQEINVVIDEEITKFKATRECCKIYDNMDGVLRQEINKVGNRTYLWIFLVSRSSRTTQVEKSWSCLKLLRSSPKTLIRSTSAF